MIEGLVNIDNLTIKRAHKGSEWTKQKEKGEKKAVKEEEGGLWQWRVWVILKKVTNSCPRPFLRLNIKKSKTKLKLIMICMLNYCALP